MSTYDNQNEVLLSKNVYYIKNVQQPITRQTEVIFRNLLFTIVVLGLFDLLFLLCKLLIASLVQIVHNSYREFRVKNHICVTKNDNRTIPIKTTG